MIEFRTLDGFTPFLTSCKNNNFPIFKTLYDEDCDILVQCKDLNNALHYSVSNENMDMVKILVSADAENNILKH